MTQTLLVTGASGHFGRLVLDELLKSDTIEPGAIVAATRDVSKLADYAARGVQVRAADFDDPGTLVAAFAGVDRLLLISTDAMGVPGRRLAQHKAAVAAAQAAGVKHIVYTSLPEPEVSAVSFAPDHLGTEEAIAASGIAHTILRNSWYMENLFMGLPHALETGKWFTAAGGGKIAYAARADEAAAAAHALAGEGQESAIHTIAGPEAVSVDEVAAMVREITGKPLEVVHVDEEQLAAGMKAGDVPDFMIPVIVSFDRAARQGHLGITSDALERLSGREPMHLKAFLAANREALGG